LRLTIAGRAAARRGGVRDDRCGGFFDGGLFDDAFEAVCDDFCGDFGMGGLRGRRRPAARDGAEG
jgi:hypothetical protein